MPEGDEGGTNSCGVIVDDREFTMAILETLKLILEIITTAATAFVVILHLFKKYKKPVRNFFKFTLPSFFRGYTCHDDKIVRFFKGLKLQREQNAAIIKAIAPDFKMEEVLVLDKEALFEIISKSGAFHKICQRKK
jgi:hypothetical protein